MSVAPTLVQILTEIDQAALAVILEPPSPERREALKVLIERHVPLLAEQDPSDEAGVLSRKIAGVGQQLVAALAGPAGPSRQGLMLSYVRTMRGFIVRWRQIAS